MVTGLKLNLGNTYDNYNLYPKSDDKVGGIGRPRASVENV